MRKPGSLAIHASERYGEVATVLPMFHICVILCPSTAGSGEGMDKAREILEELRMVLAGRSNFLDTLLPPLFFVLLSTFFNLFEAL